MLQVENISCRFGGLVALDNVSLEVKKKELVGLMGPNGAGKTTLFNIITGFISPTSGKVYLKGEDITNLPPHLITRRGLARTFQNVRVFEHLNVLQNVEVAVSEGERVGLLSALFPTSFSRHIKRYVKDRAYECLKLLGLESFAKKDATSLTFGQQRLLGIARAIASNPKILLLDEPSAGLNQNETFFLSSAIKRICREGTSIFIIEHDIDMLMDVAQRIIVLDRGKKIAEGTPDKVREEELVLQAYFGRRRRCLA